MVWDGPHSLPLANLLRGVILPTLKRSLLQHTLSIIGSLDIVGSPTVAIQVFRCLTAFLYPLHFVNLEEKERPHTLLIIRE